MRRALGIVLLVGALAQLGFRGMQRVRNEVPMWDFFAVYSATRTWIDGHNPYDSASVMQSWRDAAVFSNRDVGYWVTVYPPTSLLMIAPFAVLPANVAMIAWLALMFALLAVQFTALLDLAGLSRRDPRALLLVGAALAAAPLQFGILSGQLSIPAISLCVIAFWWASRHREKLAGVLLGLACALKPQIGAPFVLYYLIVRRRDVRTYAIVVGGAICLLALGAMQLSHVDWLTGWTRSIAISGEVGGVNDYGWAGVFRDEIVDLKMLLVSVRHDPLILRIAIEVIAIGLIAWYVRCYPRARQRIGEQSDGRSELLALATLAAISLLPLYHRVYDAALLTTALAWALAELDGKWRRHALLLCGVMSIFLIPFDIVQTLGYRIPGVFEISRTWWWQSFIAPHYAWGLFGLTIALLATMTVQAATRRAPKPATPAREGVFAVDEQDEDVMIAR